MNREDGRGPPSPHDESWGHLTDRDAEGHYCGTTCIEVYHSGVSPVRSAMPLNDWIMSPYLACAECFLPLIGFCHTRCGD